MGDTTFTFQVDERLKEQFAAAARDLDSTGEQLLREFMHDFVNQRTEPEHDDEWFRRQVQIGLDEADAGLVVPGEEVEAHFAARCAELKRKLNDKS